MNRGEVEPSTSNCEVDTFQNSFMIERRGPQRNPTGPERYFPQQKENYVVLLTSFCDAPCICNPVRASVSKAIYYYFLYFYSYFISFPISKTSRMMSFFNFAGLYSCVEFQFDTNSICFFYQASSKDFLWDQKRKLFF